MFDLQATDGSVRRRAFKSPIPGGETSDDGFRATPANKLDSEPMARLHTQLLSYYARELDRQMPNREQMAIDEDFYDNTQWRDEDAQILEERGQVPLVYNVIAAAVDWVLGTQRRTRTDYKILPRRKEDEKPAERKTALMKYLSDANRSPFHISRAFSDATKAGVGWIEDGVSDADDGEPLYRRYEDWRYILWDSTAVEIDVNDGRYMFRAKWVDLDIAEALTPERRSLLDASADVANDFLGRDAYGDTAMDMAEMENQGLGDSHTSELIRGWQRQRVRIIEAWFRKPVKARRMKGGPFDGEIYDPYSPGHADSLSSGEARIIEKTTMRMHVALMTPKGLLWLSESPYRHNRYPFTPVWGYRRRRDGLPYGMIRRLRDIQEDINKRASKALHILSTNKVIMDEGALGEDFDIDEFLEEVSRPDAVIVKRKGYDIDINAERELSQYQLEFMSRSIAMIEQSSGVTNELLGRGTNAKSGVAIQRRQEQGSMATAQLFDNLRFALQVSGEKQLSLLEQFMSEKKAFRITNERGNPEFVNINDELPENDVTRSKADFVISDQDWRATMREAAADSLMEIMSKLPGNVAMVLLDLVVENMDLPNRDAIVARIRQVTGQRDPDATELTPEEQAQAQQQQQDAQLLRAEKMTEIRKKAADAAEKEMRARKIAAEIAGDNVDAQAAALDAAREAMGLPPEATHMADHILAESGFVSKSDQEAAALEAAQQHQAHGLPAPQTQPEPAQPGN